VSCGSSSSDGLFANGVWVSTYGSDFLALLSWQKSKNFLVIIPQESVGFWGVDERQKHRNGGNLHLHTGGGVHLLFRLVWMIFSRSECGVVYVYYVREMEVDQSIGYPSFFLLTSQFSTPISTKPLRDIVSCCVTQSKVSTRTSQPSDYFSRAFHNNHLNSPSIEALFTS